MNTALAIYDALLQAGIGDAPARRVVEALEQDMTTLLATKQDLMLVKQDVQLVRQDVLLLKQDLQHFDNLMVTRFEALESRVSLKMENLESKIVVKLGALMTLLFGVATAVQTLLR
jgi:hypothetical protein